MPGQNILFKLTADERAVIKAFRNVTDGVKTAGKATEKLTSQTKKLEQGSKTLEKQAARMWRKAMTPLQRYKTGMKETTQLLIKQKLTVEQVRQVRKNLQRTLQRELGLTAAAARGDAKRAARLREVAAASRQAGAASQRALGGMLITARSLLSSLGLVGGVAGAVQLVRMEFDRLNESRQRARDVSLPLAKAERAALRNLGAQTVEEQQIILDKVEALSNKLRVPRQGILEGASTALSARGAQSASLALEAVSAGIRLAPDDPQTSTAIAGAALDITKLGEGITPEEAAGFLAEGLIRARVTASELFARSSPRAISSAVARGATPREGLALFAAITQGTVDPQGRRSVTAAIQFAEQLAKPLEKAPQGDTPEAIQKRADLEKLEAVEGIQARIKFLQENKQVRKTFIDVTNFETNARASIESLLTAGQVFREFSKNLRELPKAAEAGPTFERQVRVQGDTELQRIGAFSRGVKQVAESIAISDPTAARLGVIQEEFGPILEQTGSTRLAANLAKLSGTVEGLSAFLRITERQAARLEKPTELRVIGDAAGQAMVRIPREPTRAEEKQLEAITLLIELLKQAIDESRQAAQKPPSLLPQPGARTGLQIESPLRTNPAIQEQRARLGEFFVPLAEPTIPGSTEARRRPDAQHLTPPGSPTLLTPTSSPAVQPTSAGTATSTQQDPRPVVAAVDRVVQKMDQATREASQGSDRVVDAIRQQDSASRPRMLFDEPTLGSPGTMDVNNPADPEDR